MLDQDLDALEVPETTGKFGTGFMTTHLLSKIVTVSGIFATDTVPAKYHQFSINLDRSAKNKKDMIISFQRIYDKLKNLDNPKECPIVK